jgi:tetratricopeptide (TPR) repeat protein
VALRNAAVGGVFLPTTSQLGPNFYIGNNPHADGTYAPLLAGLGDPAHERQDATALAERALGQRLSPAEVSGYWLAQGLDFIAHAPGNWLRLMARKTALALNAVELADTEDIYTYALWSPVLRGLLPLFHFGVLLPLAAFGTIVTWRRRREHGLLYALAGAYLASVILIYVFARYRFPLALILALFAGAGLAQAKAWWLEKRTVRRWLPAVGVMLAAILVANLPLVARASFRAPTLCNIAYAWIEQRNDPERARPFAERALAFEPEYANAHHLLGVLQATKGELDEAEASFRHAIAREPARALTYVQLGDVLIRRGRLPEAVAAFREATRLDPTDPATLNNLAGLLAGMQRYDEALACLQRAIELAEDPWEIRVNVALILRQSGRTAEANALLAKLVSERPDDPRAQRLRLRTP